MKTGNQQLIENLTNENERLKAVIENLQRKVEHMENKNVFDEITQKENLKYISDEIIIRVEKYFRGKDEITSNNK